MQPPRSVCLARLSFALSQGEGLLTEGPHADDPGRNLRSMIVWVHRDLLKATIELWPFDALVCTPMLCARLE